MKKSLIVVAIIAILAFLFTQDLYLGPRRYSTWMEEGAGKLIPNPDDVLGRKVYRICEYNASNHFAGYIYLKDTAEFEKYADAIFESQFRIDFHRYRGYFVGTHVNVFRPRTIWCSASDEDLKAFICVYEN